VYRFHQVAELVAFSALEMALRERYIAENQDVAPKRRLRGLNNLLQHAKSQQWITNEGLAYITRAICVGLYRILRL